MKNELSTFKTELIETHAKLRRGLHASSRDYEWRISQLKALKKLITENETELCDAVFKDLRKGRFECLSTELGAVLSEIDLVTKKLKDWMKPSWVSTPIYNQPGRSSIVREPLGLTLIIGAWNYPINLVLTPLIGAIAGGNAALIKPSEISPNTARVLSDLVPRYLDRNLFAVCLGGAEETGQILDEKFDLIFFTGSSSIGKEILKKAANHLTPTILELGGKSPAIVWKDADLDVTARRLVWGKFLNAGQTCIAPDYLLVHPEIREALKNSLVAAITEFYGRNPESSQDYSRIVNTKNFDRLQTLLSESEVLHGGKTDRDDLYIQPTIVQATAQSSIMRDEIFGPILPIIEMGNLDQIIEFINKREKPLALYVFTKDSAVAERFVDETSSGAVCVNDDVMHMPVPDFPFGGVGASGMGSYHGRHSFESFTHAKSVLRKSFLFDVPIRYPPHSEAKANLIKRLF